MGIGGGPVYHIPLLINIGANHAAGHSCTHDIPVGTASLIYIITVLLSSTVTSIIMQIMHIRLQAG